jgi:hypothetical protein
MSSGGSGTSKGTASYTALTYLSLFGLAVTVPLLLLLGALLLQSVSVQREQLERRVLQVLEEMGTVLTSSPYTLVCTNIRKIL